jgi:hypothetical protein
VTRRAHEPELDADGRKLRDGGRVRLDHFGAIGLRHHDDLRSTRERFVEGGELLPERVVVGEG